MTNRLAAALVAASLALQFAPSVALADNQMGYRLLSPQQAAQLPRGGGVLGINVGAGQQINDSGLSFELLRVSSVRPRSPGAQAGLNVGDQIIAVDGRVFPSVAAFAAYVGSAQPGQQIAVDYIPNGGGPQQAQRIGVVMAGAGGATSSQQTGQAKSSGLSKRSKIAIGVGAAAILCYELGCFSRSKPQPAPAQ